MKRQEIEFSWDGTGKLEIEMFGNQKARLSYRPSEKFVAETLAKFRQTTYNRSKSVRITKPQGEAKRAVEGVKAAHKRQDDRM